MATGSDDVGVRKVPPRTPINRMNTLMKFANIWIQSQIRDNRPERATRMATVGLARLETRLLDAFDRCGYFDPSVLNGGPRPPPARQAASRKRRDEESLLSDNSTSSTHDTSSPESSTSSAQKTVDDSIDIFDESEENILRGSSIRLSADVDMAWKQISTGIRKWILRYLAECSGEIRYQNHTNRFNKVRKEI